ncbi:MAG: HD domain-containing protein [bacterium]|nr:HD domain-containing protein [bacterium]
MKIILPKHPLEIIKKLESAGFEAYAVGGGIRDLLLKRQIPIKSGQTDNWDFTTNASPEQIQKVFPDSFYANTFGTVTIVEKEKDKEEKYEITTYRVESSYADFRHPGKISWGKTLEEDLSRRELTISAMAVGADGELIDPYGGEKDLKAGLIRTVGNPEKRFGEDALRLMRAIRIATQLGFVIEEKTFAAIKKNAELIKKISGERVRDELIKILKTNHPADGIMLLHNSGLLAHIFPEVEKGYGMAQSKHHKYDVFKHSVESLRFCPSKDWPVRLATFLHDVGKPVTVAGENENRTFYNHEVAGASIARHIAALYRFSREDREKLVTLIRWHQFSVDEFQTDKAIRRFIKRVGNEYLKDIFDLRIGDRLGGGCLTATSWRLRKYMQRTIEVQKHTPSIKDLKINGYDIMSELKIKPGPMVGKILESLFAEIMEEPEKNEKEYLLKKAKSLLGALSAATTLT